MKKTWDGIRDLIGGGKKRKKEINAMAKCANSQLIHDPQKISNILNNHFASCGHRLAAKMPHSEKHFSEYLPKQNTDYENIASQHGSFAFFPVTPSEIELEITLLPINKSYGLYSCPIRILKCAKNILSISLADIINTSIERGIYPKKLKIAKIIPIYKDGVDTDPNNYRPISLLSIFNKIFEILMNSRLKNFLKLRNFFSDSQYGFREQYSTQHALLDIINKIQSNMDNKLFSCGIFIDLKKAFDTVDHDILLCKLKYYGIRGVVNDWFSSYLKNRSQTTLVGNCISDKEETLCGVPQGSVLGPLLFLIYINDICNSSKVFNFFLFADDTNLLYANKSLKTLESVVNFELREVCKWLNANKLTLNIKKSNFVIFRPSQKPITYQPTIKLFDNNSKKYIPLESKDYIKYLGILIDYNLSWKQHINYIALKISKTVGIIAKLRHYVPFHTLMNIYKSLIQPYLSYGVVAWGYAAKKYTDKLLKLQKRVLRLIYFKDNRAHSIPLFISSNTLPINMLYIRESANLLHDISNEVAPIALQELFTKTCEIHRYNTRAAANKNFYINSSRLEIQKRSFSRFGSFIWNSISPSFRAQRKHIFKTKLNKTLMTILQKENDHIDLPLIINRLPIETKPSYN